MKISSSRSSGKVVVLHHVLHGLGDLEQACLLGEHPVAAQAVDRAVAGRDGQPGAGIGRGAVARPALGGGRERLLRRFLGEVDVTQEADQVGEDAPPLVAEDLLEQGYLSASGRTSIAPPSRATGIRAAISSAPSRSSASTMAEAAHVLLRIDERAVGEQRLPVLDAHGRRGLDRLQPRGADDPRQPLEGAELLANRLLLVRGQPLERIDHPRRVDLEQVPHGVLLRAHVLAEATNVTRARGQPRLTHRLVAGVHSQQRAAVPSGAACSSPPRTERRRTEAPR